MQISPVLEVVES